jgi:hypothetical protein
MVVLKEACILLRANIAFLRELIEMQAELSAQMVIVGLLNISYWYFIYPASRLELVNLDTFC